MVRAGHPGTRQVTLGGAVAADVHGKNHHRDGSIGRHIRSLDLLTGDGEVRTIGPDLSPDLFWATTGGMGLTGVILRVTLELVAVESSWVLVDTERAPDLDAVLAGLRAADERVPLHGRLGRLPVARPVAGPRRADERPACPGGCTAASGPGRPAAPSAAASATSCPRCPRCSRRG